MFSPGSSPIFSHNRKLNRSQELYRKHAASPSPRMKKSSSVNEMGHMSDSTRICSSAPTSRAGKTTTERGLQPPHHPRSFSPTRSFSPGSPSSSSSCTEERSSSRVHPLPCKDQSPVLNPESSPSSNSTSLLEGQNVGLRYTSRLLQSPAS